MINYAHSKKGCSVDKWQTLENHLCNVSSKAGTFAEIFGAKEWAQLLGYFHDLGKGTFKWQAFLRYANNIEDEFSKYYEGHPPHSLLGARKVYQLDNQAGKLLSYCIAGHHTRMPNWVDEKPYGLRFKLAQENEEGPLNVPTEQEIPAFPKILPITTEKERLGFQIQFFARMLFSCLIDADRLDTKDFVTDEKPNNLYPKMEEISEIFWTNFNVLRQNSGHTTNINKQRELILNQCIIAAKKTPGIFSLTAPTGGGKTLSSMAFAINHAVKYNKDRIIYVIPFTSIIEQTAEVFNNVIGEGLVLQHHCNFIVDDTDEKAKMATENWNAPIIVTTNVQFFNSFYSNRASKCRKLHNIANSVVIFDEAQTIPINRIKPCLEVIRELSLNYKVTSVICTATQPAIKHSDSFTVGLKNVREIIKDVPSLFSVLRRTKETFVGEITVEDLCNKLQTHDQVLCIVNTRAQALEIFRGLPDNSHNIHLSALMYPMHRLRILRTIRELMAKGEKCRVVSTQLIEAGIDLDFPYVFRAEAGIEAIAQAAGRCNRNGKLNVGEVCIFKLTGSYAPSFLRQSIESTNKLISEFNGSLTSPECVFAYFSDLFWKNSQRMDSEDIIGKCKTAARLNIQFKEIAKFNLIQSANKPIVVAVEPEAETLINKLNYFEFKLPIIRRLQKFSVQLYNHQIEALNGWIEHVDPDILVVRSKLLYSAKTGLLCSPPENNAFFG